MKGGETEIDVSVIGPKVSRVLSNPTTKARNAKNQPSKSTQSSSQTHMPCYSLRKSKTESMQIEQPKSIRLVFVFKTDGLITHMPYLLRDSRNLGYNHRSMKKI